MGPGGKPGLSEGQIVSGPRWFHLLFGLGHCWWWEMVEVVAVDLWRKRKRS